MMKKLLLSAAIAVFAMSSINAQDFGLKAGADFASLTAKGDGESFSVSELRCEAKALILISVMSLKMGLHQLACATV